MSGKGLHWGCELLRGSVIQLPADFIWIAEVVQCRIIALNISEKGCIGRMEKPLLGRGPPLACQSTIYRLAPLVL